MGPLRFAPILKRIRWGGRRLGEILGKPIGPERDYAESWELCDCGDDQSVVIDGPARGWPLRRLIRERGIELLGRQAGLDRFPLLFKFLDASDRLSVQVHPNDEQAQARHPGERGKTEAWVILEARPESRLFVGLRPGVDRKALATAVDAGDVERCLHPVPAVAGQCLFIPAGTVHAIGEGVLLAEVQQSSDRTYRLFDWNRLGTDSKPRPLHVEESLACADFERGPVDPVIPKILQRNASGSVEELVNCPQFRLLRRTMTAPGELPADDTCRVLMGLEGTAQITAGDGTALLNCGDTLLLPAAAVPRTVVPKSRVTFLDVTWP